MRYVIYQTSDDKVTENLVIFFSANGMNITDEIYKWYHDEIGLMKVNLQLRSDECVEWECGSQLSNEW